VIKSDNTKFEITTDIVADAFFNVNERIWGIDVPSIDLEFTGERDKKVGFDFSLDMDQLLIGDYNQVLDQAYIYFLLPRDFSITVGMFKTPFGEEIALGKRKRPYPSHSLGSDEIAPGTDKGISIASPRLFGLWSIEYGIFHGRGGDVEIANYNQLLTTGKTSLSFDLNLFAIELGYSAMYKWEHATELLYRHTFAHGAFFKGTFEPQVAGQKVFLLTEYLEKHVGTNAINDAIGWGFSFFNAVAYTVKLVDVFATFELYRENTRQTTPTPNDEWLLSAGVNILACRDFRISLVYELEKMLATEETDQQVSALFYLHF
jgi:hypothetical protein